MIKSNIVPVLKNECLFTRRLCLGKNHCVNTDNSHKNTEVNDFNGHTLCKLLCEHNVYKVMLSGWSRGKNQ